MPPGSQDIAEIKKFIDAGEALGIALPAHLRAKLDAVGRAGTGKLRIALVGGFSEGKTSLVAAWLGRVTDDMRIGQRETTASVTVYEAGDGVQLIDTPGLFGFGEVETDAGIMERFKDMTRHYVSEADLVLYVVSPTNPLKDSHRAELNWLLRDLDLLPRTVFVIGRFDKVADVEDDEEYEHHVAIKRASVAARLQDVVELTPTERADLAIAGVAADPFGKGLDWWFARPEDHSKASRMPMLRSMTADKLASVGGSEEAKRATCLTILNDVADQLVEPARHAAADTAKRAALADDKAKEEGPRLDRFRREAADAQVALRNQITDLLTDVIVEAKSTDMDAFEEFFDRKIGRDGVVIGARIKSMFTEELGPVSHDLFDLTTSFAAETENALLAGLFGKATGAIRGGAGLTNKTVLKMRDWVKPVMTIKFKPYQAIKTARFANGALAGFGIALEGWQALRDHQRQQRFAESRAAIVKELEDQRAMLLDHVDEPTFLTTYFPQIGAMEELFATLSAAFRDAAERDRLTREWAKDAEELRSRFRLGTGAVQPHSPASAAPTTSSLADRVSVSQRVIGHDDTSFT